ncbi:ATP-binding cassette domain-containing protein [Mesorhizobium sp. B4-1-4]|nr:ATP-binding cassette domain-containing protein [Mesorhizobium sp. B4-1-4]
MSAPLFSNLDLTIGSGDRLGIVAANGRGKSTLLKCLTGEMEPTSGDMTRTRGLRIGHVEQSVPPALLGRTFQQVVADALPAEQADSEMWRVDVVLDSLDVPEDMRGRKQAAKLNNIGMNSGSDLLTVKTRQLKDRAEKLEDAAVAAHRERSAGTIRLANRGTHAKVLITLDDAAVETPDGTLLFRTGRRHICQGDRIVLLGRNGVGKSRFVTLIRNPILEPETAENVKVTPSTVLGYSDQALSGISGDDTPVAMVSRRHDVGEQRARSLLAGAGVSIDVQERKIGVLSGGQKARLMMLALRLADPNFYLLDEPTNHLDIDGQEALEAELLAHEASCVLASHDRSFIRAIGNRFWLIEKRKLTEVDDPEDFFRQVAQAAA